MGTEFGNAADAPGVQVSERPSQPAAQTLGLELSGMVGIFRRGPTDESWVPGNWEEFKRMYGGYHEGNHGPVLADHFFKQRKNNVGASQLAIGRAVGTDALTGSTMLVDSSGVDTLKLDASSAGKWSLDAEVTTERYIFTTVTALVISVPISSIEIVEADAFNYIEIGDLVHITDGTNTEKAFVAAVDNLASTITVKEFTPAASIAGGSDIKCNTAHRATTTTTAETRHNATEMLVESGRNFKSGMRILLEDSVGSGHVDNGLVYRVSGNKIYFDPAVPLSLTEVGSITGYVTGLTADTFGSDDLAAFDGTGLGDNLVGQSVAWTGGAGGGPYVIDTFTKATGAVKFTTNITEDVDAGESFTIAGVELTGETTGAGVAGVQAFGTIQIILNPTGEGDVLTINGTDFTEGVEWNAGIDIAATLAVIFAAMSGNCPGIAVTTDLIDTLTFTCDTYGTAGNAMTLVENDNAGDNFTLSGAVFTGGVAATLVDIGLAGFDAACGIVSGTYSNETITGFVPGTGTVEVDDSTTALNVAGTTVYQIDFDFNSWVGVTSCAHNTFIDVSLLPALYDGETLDLTNGGADDLVLMLTGVGAGTTNSFKNSLSNVTAEITGFDELTGTITFDGEWDDVPIPGVAITFSIALVPNIPYAVDAGTYIVSQEFYLITYDLSEQVDIVTFLSMEPTSDDYIGVRLAGSGNETYLVEAVDQSSATYITNPIYAIPAPVSKQPFTGGVEGVAPTDAQMIGSSGANKTGMYLFNAYKIDYFCIPGYYSKTVVDAAREYCEPDTGKGDCIFITAVPESTVSALDAKTHRNTTLNYMSTSFITMLNTWYYIKDPESSLVTARTLIPPEAGFMGMWSRIAESETIAKPPANEEIFGLVGVAYNIGEGTSDAGLLNAAGVNVIFWRQSDGKYIVYGAKTLDKNPGKRQFNSCRRIFNYVVRNLYIENQEFIYGISSPVIGVKILMKNNSFFTRMQRDGLLDELGGGQPFTVVSDMTNNTLAGLRAGKRVVSVLFEPAVPLEQLAFNVGITSENVTVTES